MDTIVFAFKENLNDFLAKPQREKPVVVECRGNPTIKHLVEALGVPHVEIGEVTANGKTVSLGERVRSGDRIEVRPAPPGCPTEPRFLLDNHLGRLAVYLRMLGFDCLYRNDFQDAHMAGLLVNDPRILLSRDRRLLMRKVVRFGYCLRSLQPEEQLHEVVRRFRLAGLITPFRRCLRCNGLLEPVSKEAVLERLQPLTKKYYQEFSICRACDQVYWKGSHYERMETMLQRLLRDEAGPAG